MIDHSEGVSVFHVKCPRLQMITAQESLQRVLWVVVMIIGQNVICHGGETEEVDTRFFGNWKVIAVSGEDYSALVNLTTLSVEQGAVARFTGPAGQSAARFRVTNHEDKTSITFDGTRDLNGNDLSFVYVADLSFAGDLMRLQWKSRRYPAPAEELRTEIDMWLQNIDGVLKDFYGQWRVEWSSVDGKIDPMRIGQHWSIDRNSLEIVQAAATKEDVRYAVAFKNALTPVAFSRRKLDAVLPTAASKPEYGIIEKRGSRLYIAISPIGTDAPQNFKSQQGTGIALSILRKIQD